MLPVNAPQAGKAFFTKQDTRNQEVCVGSTCIQAVNVEVIPPEEKRSAVVAIL